MRLFITGGSGFIGRNLVETLRKKYVIFAPTRTELELLNEDAVRKYLEHKRVDVVIHCAVRPGHRNAKDPSRQLHDNVRMFFNVARNGRFFQKMIMVSSGLVYDTRYYQPKMKEEYFDTHVPLDEGGFSKYLCAKYIENTDTMVELRPFGVFGKYEDYAIRFISNAICKTLFDLPITIQQNRRFDYVYIKDLISIIDYFIQHPARHKSYNITPDRSEELYSLAERVTRISGKDIPLYIAEGGMGTEYSGDNGRLRSEMRDLKFTEIDGAIKELYDWYASTIKHVDRKCLLFDK